MRLSSTTLWRGQRSTLAMWFFGKNVCLCLHSASVCLCVYIKQYEHSVERSASTHPSLTTRPYCWTKLDAASTSGNISIRARSSTGNAVDRWEPTVWAMFRVSRALDLTWTRRQGQRDRWRETQTDRPAHSNETEVYSPDLVVHSFYLGFPNI